ncbi:MAG TPA: DinB family protein [Thermoanaerobaculia bacterium]|nr:DinB family protein [Thermoanaerobaculia bacterium]
MRAPFLCIFLIATALPAATLKPTGFRGDLLSDLDEVQDKIERLAGAMPQEKYNWRPAPGVRSVSEVFMHVAGGNYVLGTFIGPPPTDVPKDLESITDKAAVRAELKRSFTYLRHLITTTSDSDLDRVVKVFGTPQTERAVLITMLTHLHEHLGQSIAYARMNGVVPPWSQ